MGQHLLHMDKKRKHSQYTILNFFFFFLKSMESYKLAINLFFTYKPKGNSNIQCKLKSSVFQRKKKVKNISLKIKKNYK